MNVQSNNVSKLRELRTLNIATTIQDVRESLSWCETCIQITYTIQELEVVLQRIGVKLCDLIILTLPELEHTVNKSSTLARLILEHDWKTLVSMGGTDPITTMGKQLAPEEMEQLKSLARTYICVEEEQSVKLTFLKSLMEQHAPNISCVAGSFLAAKLLAHAGSLRALCMMPGGTLQLIGAERALFRHLTQGARSPKHGIIHEHPLVLGAKEKGKAARALADKMVIAARIDYFKGTFQGDQLRAQLDKKFLTSS